MHAHKERRVRLTVLASSVALAFAHGVHAQQVNDAGISGATQHATSSRGNINQTELTSSNSSNGTLANNGFLLNGVQANDGSAAAQIGSTGVIDDFRVGANGQLLANFGTLASFNTRIVSGKCANPPSRCRGNRTRGASLTIRPNRAAA